MLTISGTDLGTIAHGRDIGRTPGSERYKLVACYNAESGRGCGDRRWAIYKGPILSGSNYRLCTNCNRELGRLLMQTYQGPSRRGVAEKFTTASDSRR